LTSTSSSSSFSSEDSDAPKRIVFHIILVIKFSY
jgi:hypothetical protein